MCKEREREIVREKEREIVRGKGKPPVELTPLGIPTLKGTCLPRTNEEREKVKDREKERKREMERERDGEVEVNQGMRNVRNK